MELRVYQIKSDALAYTDKRIRKGDWMVQCKSPQGYWRNLEGPFRSEEAARKYLEVEQAFPG